MPINHLKDARTPIEAGFLAAREAFLTTLQVGGSIDREGTVTGGNSDANTIINNILSATFRTMASFEKNIDIARALYRYADMFDTVTWEGKYAPLEKPK